ncbi:MAG: 3-methylornithine--L-lysine ligase PylC [Desulfobulbus sp.]
MKVLILGGRLQGVELVYLAAKAGWQTTVVDRDPLAPASGLCDRFAVLDLNDRESLLPLMREADFVVPAIEDKPLLDRIEAWAQTVGVRFAYDREAYLLSSSKIHSDGLFALLGIPAPRPWPQCGFPMIVKPSGASGSKGVACLENAADFEQWQQRTPQHQQWVKQEFLHGPSYSIEVIGAKGTYRSFALTELEMDSDSDCKRVLAPVELPPALEAAFRGTALTLAETLQLEGIMDVEVILHQGQLKVLEIDARFPSQTPTAVYHSTGINLLETLCTGSKGCARPTGHGVVFEHLRVTGNSLGIGGEHIMADAGPLRLHQGFFGADEALTNYQPGSGEWMATLICTGKTLEQARAKRERVIERILRECGLDRYLDPQPAHPLPVFSPAMAA